MAGHHDWLVPLRGVVLVLIDQITYLVLTLIDCASVVRSDAGVVGHWGMETT